MAWITYTITMATTTSIKVLDVRHLVDSKGFHPHILIKSPRASWQAVYVIEQYITNEMD